MRRVHEGISIQADRSQLEQVLLNPRSAERWFPLAIKIAGDEPLALDQKRAVRVHYSSLSFSFQICLDELTPEHIRLQVDGLLRLVLDGRIKSDHGQIDLDATISLSSSDLRGQLVYPVAAAMLHPATARALTRIKRAAESTRNN